LHSTSKKPRTTPTIPAGKSTAAKISAAIRQHTTHVHLFRLFLVTNNKALKQLLMGVMVFLRI
jgi:hypothetical protein